MLFSDVAVTKYAETTSEVEEGIDFWFKDSSKGLHWEKEKSAKLTKKESNNKSYDKICENEYRSKEGDE